jgi:hypothetical protein
MTTLHACLQDTPRRTLLVIARQRGLAVPAATPKARLIETLSSALLETDSLQRALLQLTGDERAALSTLLRQSGPLPRATFEHRFGSIRPYQPWRKDVAPQPWLDPVGPGERLFYLGLIFYRTVGQGRHVQTDLLIPADLASSLTPLLALSSINSTQAVRASATTPGVPPDPCRDIAWLLGLLQRDDVRPLHGRWLPPRVLRAWNARCSMPESTGDLRSELQTRYLRTLHFIAEAAGLVTVAGGWLLPTTRAWEWLSADSETQWRWLWEAWPRDPSLWNIYRLPGHSHPTSLARFQAALPQLAPLAANEWSITTEFVSTFLSTHISPADEWERWEPDYHMQALVDLITGFLAHLGLTEIDGARFRLTPIGAWLLGGSTPDLPRPTAMRLALAPDTTGRLSVEVPSHPNLAHLARLIALADKTAVDSARPCLSLSAESVNRARGRGAPLEEILGLLENVTGAPLPRRTRATLHDWDKRGAHLTISRVTLLETDDPALLSALTRQRRFRRRINRTLSPRALVLDEAGLDAAIAHLRRAGYHPRLIGIPDQPRNSSAVADHAALLLARSVYQGLARFIALPAPLPASIFIDLEQRLSPSAIAAAEAQAARVLDALAAALDGWTPLPSPQPGHDQDTLRPSIEAAIRDGQLLRLAYWTAGRGELTHRLVEPYRLEQRGYTLYLIGYCREARAERIFRLDRIQDLQTVDQSDAEGSPDS